jgi:hydroxylamine reductase
MTNYHDTLIGSLIGLARSIIGNEDLVTSSTKDLLFTGIFTLSNNNEIINLLTSIENEKKRLTPNCYNCLASCGKTNNFDLQELNLLPKDIKELKLKILEKLESLSPNIYKNNNIDFNILTETLFIIGLDNADVNLLNQTLNKLI